MSQQKLSLRNCTHVELTRRRVWIRYYEYVQRKETYTNDVSANRGYDNEVETVKRNQITVELKSAITEVKKEFTKWDWVLELSWWKNEPARLLLNEQTCFTAERKNKRIKMNEQTSEISKISSSTPNHLYLCPSRGVLNSQDTCIMPSLSLRQLPALLWKCAHPVVHHHIGAPQDQAFPWAWLLA